MDALRWFWDRIPTLRRIARWTFWVVLVLAIIGTAVWTTLYAVGTARMNREIRSLREAGFATSYQEMAPPAVPDEENAAPYYVAAFALLVEPGAAGPAFSPALDKGTRSLSAEEMASLRLWLAKNDDAFHLIHRARARSTCRYKRDYRLGWSMELPEISQTIKASKYLSIRAQLQAEEGDEEAARESIRDGFALADSLRDEPIVVSQLVLLIDVGILLDGLSFCVTAETPVTGLKDWSALLPPISRFDGMMEPALRGELACTVEMIEQSRDEGILHCVSPFVAQRTPDWLWRPLFRMDLPLYARLLRRMLDLSRRPYPETPAGTEELDREVLAAPAWSHPIVRTLIPAISKLFQRQAEAHAHLAVVRAGLEWEIARAATGRYPETVDAVDPLTGKPLQLRDGAIRSGATRNEEPIEWKLRRP